MDRVSRPYTVRQSILNLTELSLGVLCSVQFLVAYIIPFHIYYIYILQHPYVPSLYIYIYGMVVIYTLVCHHVEVKRPEEETGATQEATNVPEMVPSS
jgi:hypothetical protein